MAKKRKIERGRWTSQRKADVVLRLLRGEELDAVSRELGVKTSTLAQWRDEFLASGQAGLKARKPDHRDDENNRLKRMVGELTMDLELLKELIKLKGLKSDPPSRRSKP
jgi:transposase-like protein